MPFATVLISCVPVMVDSAVSCPVTLALVTVVLPAMDRLLAYVAGPETSSVPETVAFWSTWRLPWARRLPSSVVVPGPPRRALAVRLPDR